MRRRLRPKRRSPVRRFTPRRPWYDDEEDDDSELWMACGGSDEQKP